MDSAAAALLGMGLAAAGFAGAGAAGPAESPDATLAELAALALWPALGVQVARVTYTGGYVLPGATPGAGQAALPADLEWAAVEQVAAPAHVLFVDGIIPQGTAVADVRQRVRLAPCPMNTVGAGRRRETRHPRRVRAAA